MPRQIRKKVKVPLYGAINRTANIEDGATRGATIGTDLFFEDGSLVTIAALAALLTTGAAAGPTPLPATLWRLIREVPIYTTSPTSPTWEYTLDGDPIGNVGFAAVADALATGSLAGDLVLAPTAGRIFSLSDVVLEASTADQLRVGNSGTDGYIALSRATGATAPGYARFYDAAGVARGYVGFHDSSSRITLTSENAWGIKIDSDEDVYLDADTLVRLIAPQAQLSPTANLPLLPMNGASSIYLNAGGSGAGDAFWLIQRYNTATGGPDLGFYHSKSASVGTHTILASGDEIGSVSFYASDGTSTPVKVARIIGFINGTVGGATDLPSRLDFFTTPDGSATSQRVLRLSPELIQADATEIEVNLTTFDINATTTDLSGVLVVAGVATFNASETVMQAAGGHIIRMRDTSAGTDQKRFRIRTITGTWLLSSENDSGTQVEAAITVTKASDGTIAEVQLDADVLDFNGELDALSITSAAGAAALTVNAGYVRILGSSSSGTIGLLVENALPRLALLETDAAADNQLWYVYANAERFNIGAVNDARSVVTSALFIDRTGTTIDLVTIAGTELEFNGTTLDINATTSDLSGALLVGNTATIQVGVTVQRSGIPFYRLDQTDAAADNQHWLIYAQSESFRIAAESDAGSLVPFLTVDRTGTTVDQITLAGTSIALTANTATVSGTLRVGTAGGTSNPLQIFGNDAIGDCYVGFYEDDLSTRKGYIAYGNVGDDLFYIMNEENAGLTLGTNSTTRVNIASSGEVNIRSSTSSTTTPALRVGDTGTTSTAAVASFLGAGTNAAIALRDTSNAIEWHARSSGALITLGTVTNHDLVLITNNTTRVTIENDGSELQIDVTLLDFNANQDLSGALLWTGVVTPTALAAGDNDNVNLGVGSVIRARIQGNATTSNLTSVTGGSDGKLLILTNTSANTIMIINEDAGGTAANRFAINGDMVLPANCSALFIYDGSISRWTRLN